MDMMLLRIIVFLAIGLGRLKQIDAKAIFPQAKTLGNELN
jgi:hypothetical protein